MDDDYEDDMGDEIDYEKENDQASLRRSARVSAIRATERIRASERYDVPHIYMQDHSTRKSHDHSDNDGNDQPAKKKRLARDCKLDPTDPHFAIQLDEDGDVVVLSDDSEVSSLHPDEIEFLRTNYEQLACKELSEEQRRERERMIRRLKSELRAEEAKLILLKKMRLTQQQPVPKDRPVQQQQGGAYRPPVAGALPQQQQQQQQQPKAPAKPPPLHPKTGLPMPQQAPATVTQPPTRPGPGRPPMDRPKQPQVGVTGPPGLTKGVAPQQTASPAPVRPAVVDTQTPEQKQAAAKLQLRKQLERTLLQIPPPKPPPPELQFVPNPNQIEFVFLVGLDNVVQRLQDRKERIEKIKEVKEAETAEEKERKKIEIASLQEREPPEPYRCSQCKIDFTPVWKWDEKSQTVMCDTCVKSNQKKSLKAEHTNRLKQAFVKALEQEKEIEEQIKKGTFRTQTPQPVAQASAGVSTPSSANSALPPPKLSAAPHQQQSQQVQHQTPTSSRSQASTSSAAASSSGAAASVPSTTAFAGLGTFPPMVNPNSLPMGFPFSFPPMNMNPALMAASLATMFRGALPGPSQMQQFQQMLQMMPKDWLKNIQQQSQQLALQQQKLFMDMLPKTQQPPRK